MAWLGYQSRRYHLISCMSLVGDGLVDHSPSATAVLGSSPGSTGATELQQPRQHTPALSITTTGAFQKCLAETDEGLTLSS